MLRILSKTASSAARSGGSILTGRSGDVDLSTWEIVDASQSDDEDVYSFDGDDVTSDGDGDGVLGAEVVDSEPIRSDYGNSRSPLVFVTPCDIIAVQSLSVSPTMTLPLEMELNNHAYHGDGDVHDDIAFDVDDVDDDDGVFDYDDELVPWKLKGRFGKERLRKLGKRGGPNPNKSKRMPFYYNRPGCLYGKHGFGVQHSFI